MILHVLGAPFRWISGFTGWVHAAFCALLTEEGRKGWAVIIAFGCGVSMTAYAVAALWLVRGKPLLAFWLGLAAMFIILLVITAFTGLLIKRSIGGSVSREGGSFNIVDEDAAAKAPTTP
jgi:hypothetical protein